MQNSRATDSDSHFLVHGRFMTVRNGSDQQREHPFPYSGIVIFLLFFGGSLLDAISGARITRVLFWAGMGVIFLLLDRARVSRAQ